MSSHKKFASEMRDAAVQCMESMMDESPMCDSMTKSIGGLKLSSVLYEASELHARRNMMLMESTQVLDLTRDLPESRVIHDGGMPELITETEFDEDGPVLKVIAARNVGGGVIANNDTKIPCLLSLKGPQSLYATGMFHLMSETNIPDRIKGVGRSITLPQLAINRDTVEAPLEVSRSMAGYIEGFVGYITMTPVTGGLDQAAVDAGRKSAEKSEFPEAIPMREVVDKAIRLVFKNDREAIPMKRAPKSTDVFTMDY